MLGSTDKNSGEDGSGIPDRAAYPVPEVAVLLGGVGVRYVWSLIATGELRSFKSGRLRMVARKDLDDYIDQLREEELRARAAAVGDTGRAA